MKVSREGVGVNTFGVIENTPRLLKITFGVINPTGINECFISTEGMFCSQAGNIMFPRWEYIVPSKGTISANKAALSRNKRALLSDNEQLLSKKPPSLPSDGEKPFK